MSRMLLSPLELELTNEEWLAITELAALRKVSASDVVREALRLPPLAQVEHRKPALKLVTDAAPSGLASTSDEVAPGTWQCA